MNWNLSFRLQPNEEIIDDSTKEQLIGIKPVYSVFLTNRRVVFRFDGLGSSLTQSFQYDEILDVRPCKRLFINYIQVRTPKRDFFLNIFDAEHWSRKIMGMKESLKDSYSSTKQTVPLSPVNKKRELHDMLTILRNNALLTDEEFAEKISLLDSMKF